MNSAQCSVRLAKEFPDCCFKDRITGRVFDEIRVAWRIVAAQEAHEFARVQDLRVHLVLFGHPCKDEALPVVLPITEPDAEREQKEREAEHDDAQSARACRLRRRVCVRLCGGLIGHALQA